MDLDSSYIVMLDTALTLNLTNMDLDLHAFY